MRSPRRVLYEQIRQLGTAATSTLDMAAQLRVYERGPDGKAQPAELLPTIYGGVYSPLLRGYTGDPAKRIVEVSCTRAQVPFLVHEGAEIRTLGLGAPGGGKTFALLRKVLLRALTRPNSTGGVVAPVAGAKGRLIEQFLELVEPYGWVREYHSSDEVIELHNRVSVQFVAAKSAGKETGVPFKDANWDWAAEDEHQNMSTEACQVVNLRGRRAGKDFRIDSTATDQLLGPFQMRLQEWYVPPLARVVSFPGGQNVFVDADWWQIQKAWLSAEDYKRLIEGDHGAGQERVYHAFDPKQNVRPAPSVALDMTAEVTHARFGKAYRYVIGFDPGSSVNVCHVLKAFRDPTPAHLRQPGELGVVWYVVDEFVTRGTTTAEHKTRFQQERAHYGQSEVVWLIDPHAEGKETDKSDKRQIEANPGAMDARWASMDNGRPQRIPQKHRFQMTNALWCDSLGNRRLFVAADSLGKALCPLAVQSATLYRHEDVGRKGHGDLSHYTDTLGYALFPFERIRGNPGWSGSENNPNRISKPFGQK